VQRHQGKCLSRVQPKAASVCSDHSLRPHTLNRRSQMPSAAEGSPVDAAQRTIELEQPGAALHVRHRHRRLLRAQRNAASGSAAGDRAARRVTARRSHNAQVPTSAANRARGGAPHLAPKGLHRLRAQHTHPSATRQHVDQRMHGAGGQRTSVIVARQLCAGGQAPPVLEKGRPVAACCA